MDDGQSNVICPGLPVTKPARTTCIAFFGLARTGAPLEICYALRIFYGELEPASGRGFWFDEYPWKRRIERELDELHREGVQIRHIGRTDRIPTSLFQKIQQAIKYTSGNSELILNVAMNYGGRAEIVDAVKEMIADGLDPARWMRNTGPVSLYLRFA